MCGILMNLAAQNATSIELVVEDSQESSAITHTVTLGDVVSFPEYPIDEDIRLMDLAKDLNLAMFENGKKPWTLMTLTLDASREASVVFDYDETASIDSLSV